MRLVFHGGKCCAIKTIYDLYCAPSSMHPSLKAIPKGYDRHPRDLDTVGADQAGKSFFTDAAPTETGEARLDRFLEYTQKYRPGGILEVAIVVDNPYHWIDQTPWVAVLEDRGFREVTRVKNSNSNNTVAVFHKVFEWEGIQPDEDEDDDD